jgi:hypothetical protein
MTMAVKTKTQVRPPGWVEPSTRQVVFNQRGTGPVTTHAIRCATADNGRCYADVRDMADFFRQAGQRDMAGWLDGLATRHFAELQGQVGAFSGTP